MDYVLLAMLILHCSMLMLRVALQFDRTFYIATYISNFARNGLKWGC